MIPLVYPGENHCEPFSVTIYNHYIGTLRKLLRIIASGRSEVILMDLPRYGAIARAKNTPLLPGSQADISSCPPPVFEKESFENKTSGKEGDLLGFRVEKFGSSS